MFFLVSCASPVATVKKESGRSFVVNDRSYSEVWDAAILTVSSVASIRSQDKFLGEVRGVMQGDTWDWSTDNAVVVFIESPLNPALMRLGVPPQNDSRRFTVTVVGKESLTYKLIYGQDFEDSLIATMKAYLDLYD